MSFFSMSIIFVFHVKLIPGQAACKTAILHLCGRTLTIDELLKKKGAWLLFPTWQYYRCHFHFRERKGATRIILWASTRRQNYSAARKIWGPKSNLSFLRFMLSPITMAMEAKWIYIHQSQHFNLNFHSLQNIWPCFLNCTVPWLMAA